jgi:hypothetical protein
MVAWPDARRLASDMTNALRGDRGHLGALVAIVAIGAVARYWLLGLDARYDEAYTFLNFAAVPLGTGMDLYPFPNNHLLHTFFVHDVWKVLGDSLTVIRLPALVAGILTVPAIYAAGRALYGPAAGLLAAALAAASPPLIEYSANARGYTMIWLATALLIALGARLLKQRDLATWTLWIFVAVLGLYTIPTMALPLAAVATWMAIDWALNRDKRGVFELVGAATATGVLSLLLYLNVLRQPGWDYVGPPIDDAFRFAGDVWETMHLQLGLAGQLVAAIAVVVGIVLHRRIGRQRVSLPLVALLSVPLIALALPHPPPFTRTWAYLAVIELPAVAAGVLAVLPRTPSPRRVGAAASVAVAAALCAIVVLGTPPKTDIPIDGASELAGWVESERPESTLVVSWLVQPSLSVGLEFSGADNPLVVGSPTPEPAAGEPYPQSSLLVVSRSLRQTPSSVLREVGVDEDPDLQRLQSFGETDLYELE